MNRRQFIVVGAATGAALSIPSSAGAQGAPPAGPGLIPRGTLYGNPTRAAARLSPDGKWLSWLAPADGVLNIFVAPLDNLGAARAMTASKRRPIHRYFWSPGSTHLLYLQDLNGDENWHVYSVPVGGGPAVDLTPIAGVNAQIEALSREHPTTLIAGLNDRDKAWHDLWQIDIASGQRQLVRENREELAGYVFDSRLNPRLASRNLPEGGVALLRFDGQKLAPMMTIPADDELTTGPSSFTRDGRTFYMSSSIGRDRAALFAVDWESGRETLIAEHPKADVAGTLLNPDTFEFEAAQVSYIRHEYVAVSPSIAKDLALLKARLPGDAFITARTRADDKWLIAATAAESPGVYHLYDRGKGTLTELFSTYPQLSAYKLAPMRGTVIKARDSLELVSYLSLPASEGGAEKPRRPLPMVLNVHGGPWHRDSYGYDPDHQWLANRGVAVLSVNFRGSTGFGKAFVNAGDREWGGKMLTDLLDAVDWAVKEGIAERSKVAIMGASYGGYAVLAGLTFAPEVFCCGVDIVGVSSLETFQATIPPYWKSFAAVLARRVGDPSTEEGRAFLRSRSPLHHADKIVRPLLIAQGANDPRVVKAESDQIVAAMRAKGLPVTYVLYPDEGHGFAVPENQRAFTAIAEVFLCRYLDFAPEPFGTDLHGASFSVPEGEAHIAGLTAALAARK